MWLSTFPTHLPAFNAFPWHECAKCARSHVALSSLSFLRNLTINPSESIQLLLITHHGCPSESFGEIKKKILMPRIIPESLGVRSRHQDFKSINLLKNQDWEPDLGLYGPCLILGSLPLLPKAPLASLPTGMPSYCVVFCFCFLAAPGFNCRCGIFSWGMWDLVPWLGIGLEPSALGV